ncbi:MAG TPA: DUF1653 domain-containing protein [Candidatus Paceibacterota bacterium]|nr:DUF1653 domain-containing protein [Candidatus Paceibacterota bacterium]HPT18206.1 DUF1653 domain-containing protein [Candidatus Paceibacterota bacterium]
MKLEIGSIYRHYKGTKVKVLGEALHSETLEPMVIYMHLEDGITWVRPKKMFLEKVKIGKKLVLRFQKIKTKIIIKPKK